MKTLCPNFDGEEHALETVLELPIPQDMFSASKSNNNKSWQAVRSWLSRPITVERVIFGDRQAEIQFLLGVTGAPMIPLPIPSDHHRTKLNDNIKGHPIETSMAKYIVQQYIAATGGEHALNSINSMYAMGKVKMAASDVLSGEEEYLMSLKNSNKVTKPKSPKQCVNSEIGGFVLWQKMPDLWSLELVVSGCKMSAGCDGKVAWKQTPWHHSHSSRGPARPLRRSIQGLDPRSITNLFANSICTGEKTIDDEDCFVLKLEAEPSTLKARSCSNIQIMKHTFWGYFSQKTGLLVQLEDTHLLRIKAHGNVAFWETTMDSKIHDYRTIDGVNIAHGGRTLVSLHRFGENADSDTIRTRLEEVWSIEEVDFNIKGLSTDCFLPPSDLNNVDGFIGNGDIIRNKGIGLRY